MPDGVGNLPLCTLMLETLVPMQSTTARTSGNCILTHPAASIANSMFDVRFTGAASEPAEGGRRLSGEPSSCDSAEAEGHGLPMHMA